MQSTDTVLAAGLILSRMENGKPLWLLLKNAKRGDWGFPKGHLNSGEDLVQGALRECAEESGIALLEITGDPLLIKYPVKNNREKAVHYFPACTAQSAVIISKEHTSAKWFNSQKVLKQLPHDNIKDLFKQYLRQEGLA